MHFSKKRFICPFSLFGSVRLREKERKTCCFSDTRNIYTLFNLDRTDWDMHALLTVAWSCNMYFSGCWPQLLFISIYHLFIFIKLIIHIKLIAVTCNFLKSMIYANYLHLLIAFCLKKILNLICFATYGSASSIVLRLLKYTNYVCYLYFINELFIMITIICQCIIIKVPHDLFSALFISIMWAIKNALFTLII
jgi:hypothetical protein